MKRAERRRGWRGFLGLWRLTRTTAFKLAIAYFVIVGLGFTLVMGNGSEFLLGHLAVFVLVHDVEPVLTTHPRRRLSTHALGPGPGRSTFGRPRARRSKSLAGRLLGRLRG